MKLSTRIASILTGVRPEVMAFSQVMEEQLRKNDHKGKAGWKDDSDLCTRLHLRSKLTEEFSELNNALDNQVTYSTQRHPEGMTWPTEFVRRESADQANICMMLCDNYGGGLV